MSGNYAPGPVDFRLWGSLSLKYFLETTLLRNCRYHKGTVCLGAAFISIGVPKRESWLKALHNEVFSQLHQRIMGSILHTVDGLWNHMLSHVRVLITVTCKMIIAQGHHFNKAELTWSLQSSGRSTLLESQHSKENLTWPDSHYEIRIAQSHRFLVGPRHDYDRARRRKIITQSINISWMINRYCADTRLKCSIFLKHRYIWSLYK